MWCSKDSLSHTNVQASADEVLLSFNFYYI
jgi:hypothetical protein